jgi:hypothetical protein
LFAAQLLFSLTPWIGISRSLLAPIDLTLHERGINQQTNDLFPYKLIQSILAQRSVGAYRPFQSPTRALSTT